ncbi:MAG: HAMP domain-containing sensor histidine kinase, partial [Bacteroidota bacterium]
ISDNGTGMTEATQVKLFEPFFTTKPVGEGTGLGLSIVYNTIKKHSGNIAVNSIMGQGTTFTITIPKKQING